MSKRRAAGPGPAAAGAWTVTSHSVEETRRLGEALGRAATPGTVALLSGELGAGKTVVAQGVGRGLGTPGVVNSPSYVLLVERLGGRLPLQHADLYRLESVEEVEELALAEASIEAVLLVEWPERAGDVLPPDHLALRIESGPGEADRRLTWAACGPRSERLLQAVRAEIEGGGG